MTEYTLSQEVELWVNSVFSGEYQYKCFPDNEIREEYLRTVGERTDEEVKELIRRFLIFSGAFGFDESNFNKYNVLKKAGKELEEFNKEYYRRLIETNLEYAWEGITWILDLLPKYPKRAIDTLNNYIFAHSYVLPEHAEIGIEDAIAVIRAKFIHIKHPREILISLKPKEFEWLIEKLYTEMGYDAQWTGNIRGKKADVIAINNDIGRKEKLLIECKKHKNKITYNYIDALFGALELEKANKAVLIATSTFTSDELNIEKVNPKIELIDFNKLILLLNEYLGSKWPFYIDRIINNKTRQLKSI